MATIIKDVRTRGGGGGGGGGGGEGVSSPNHKPGASARCAREGPGLWSEQGARAKGVSQKRTYADAGGWGSVAKSGRPQIQIFTKNLEVKKGQIFADVLYHLWIVRRAHPPTIFASNEALTTSDNLWMAPNIIGQLGTVENSQILQERAALARAACKILRENRDILIEKHSPRLAIQKMNPKIGTKLGQ